MARVKRGPRGARRRNAVMKEASGFRGARSKLMRTAMEAVDKAGQNAYTHRKLRKREFRQLWNARIGAAAKLNDTSYSKFMASLKKAGIEIDRKMLADLAIHHPKDFTAIVKESMGAQA